MAWVLLMTLLIQAVPVYAVEPLPQQETDSGGIQTVEEETAGSEVPQKKEPDSQEDAPQSDWSHIYENGVIKIYTLQQLQAIGSNRTLTDKDQDRAAFGSGTLVEEGGEPVTYSLDRNYQLMNEIELDGNNIWTLPENFTGHFQGNPIDAQAKLYDRETDTIYIYHNYQLKTIASEQGGDEPVMSQDMIPSEFGIGQMLYPNGEEDEQNYLRYSKEHRYVLSMDFTEEMPELKAAEIANDVLWLEGEKPDGRTMPGQLYYEDPDTKKKYILIGNESQLQAVGSDKYVTPRLYVYNPPGLLGGILRKEPSYAPYYPGDADLGLEKVAPEGGTTHKEGIIPHDVQDAVKGTQYAYYTKNDKYQLANIDLNDKGILDGILDLVGGILGTVLLGKSVICGVDETGRPNNKKAGIDDLKKAYGDLKYSADANYIIFRNIDLTADGENSDKKDENWKPIQLAGNMEGRLEMNPNVPVTISNINVHQTAPLDLQYDSGIGFFGSISSKIELEHESFKSAGRIFVKNINLDQITVQNDSSTVDKTPNSLIEGLVGLLGGLLGGLIDGLTSLLPIIGDLKLGTVIENLLQLKKDSPDLFATGSFAGRIVGDVSIENCTVTNASIHSVKGMTGGFVGYTEGETEYDGLSDILGGVVKLLSTLLNIIPGVGLGDLVTILLENDVKLGQLIPTGYYNPTLSGCSVALADGAIGNINTDYHGGFVGVQTATKMNQCSVSNLTSVKAANGAGGFAGAERDVILKGLLNDLGIELYSFDITSAQTACSVVGADLQIVAANAYAGGCNGLMANSTAETTSVSGLKKVSAKDYAGGFAGRATIGYGLAVGGREDGDKTLITSVSGLLAGLLTSGNTEKLPVLLSLTGAMPSKIRGCNVSGNALFIEAADQYAGGMIGQGDGTAIETDGAGTRNQITGIVEVAAKNYAGGIAGSISTADAIGVLNNTVGVGSYLPFTLADTTVESSGMTVHASGKYAGGTAGFLLGGKVERINVSGLEKAEAGNYAGGFAGRAGTSGLAAAGGLNILGLVKIDNVLSLAEGIAVEIVDSSVVGMEKGLTVVASGKTELTDSEDIIAGGFLGEAVGLQVTNARAEHVRSVLAEKVDGKGSYAGGFIGRSHTGGLAGIAQENQDGNLHLPGILDISSLLNLVPYLMPEYTNAVVSFVANGNDPQIQGSSAGGFAGAMQSGVVKTDGTEAYVVYGLESVKGEQYAGGFAGKVEAGAVASSDGLKLLGGLINLDIDNLLSVLNVYIPVITGAGVKSAENGFVVEATAEDSSAGGYIGYGSGVQISGSNVTSLKNTVVIPPADSLESVDGSSYFSESSSYAVRGGKYAGGYAGCVDIDSAAAVGGGLGLLGNVLELGNILSALDTVASKIENSNVSGCSGGFSVLADGTDKAGVIGKAGGFAGEISGSQIRACNVENFAYIIGREMAGGYAGMLEPGNVAAVLEDGSILEGVLNIRDSLASLVNSFIPVVIDSQTSCIPCGGAVRADGFSENQAVRGLAGGYVGYNHGGRILGENVECAVNRLRSVYGGEFAGGFTGLMENADLAGTGNISLLFGLVELGNVLSLLNAVYPTETNTAVYGPLRNVDMNTWNAWADAVGSEGVYGTTFPTDPVGSEEELGALVKNYAYGYQVRAGRDNAGAGKMQAGCAGGYVGRMQGGVVTEAHAWDAKHVSAYRSAGGFAGEMVTGGVTEVGNVKLLGLDITGSINAVQAFVPVVRNSDVTGYQSGMQVKATGISEKEGTDKIEKAGYAGGYVGWMVGGQIWGNWGGQERIPVDVVPDPANDRCFAANLRRVDGTTAVGGFAGKIDPGSAAALGTAGSDGLLGGLLQKLITTPGDLLSLLNATLSTVHAADVKAWDDWGVIVNGVYSDGAVLTKYAKAAGGFAGEINGAVIGEKGHPENGVHLENVRSVTGGEHAGGFFGLADVSAVAEITGDGNTSILGGLLKLASADVLDAFRTYIYDSTVTGAKEAGLEVIARTSKKYEYVNDPVYTGNAGGFGGTLLNSSVKNSAVQNLRAVEGQNYAGGFIGYLGKSGVVDLDNLGVFDQVIGVGAGVLDIFGSHVEASRVDGMPEGFTVRSKNTVSDTEKSEIAGGFAGYADLAKLDKNKVHQLKQVASGQVAGGFAGQTSFAYLAEIQADSWLVNKLVEFLNIVLKAIWIPELEQGQIVHINLGIITVDALFDGNLVHVDLLGLPIKISLAKEQQLATIYIGDSKIEVNCAEDGSITDHDKIKNEVNISLIKANRTRISECTVYGIPDGYDVYGGGAGNESNGDGKDGCSGGFVGFNNEGLLKNNAMYLADVVRGTKGVTGPFTGKSALDSQWEFNKLEKIEGENNQYRIYRETDINAGKLLGKNGQELQSGFSSDADWNIYTVTHLQKGKVEKFEDLKEAVISDGTNEKPAHIYMEDGAMAVLMQDIPTNPTEPGGGEEAPDIQDPCDETVELRIKKVWKADEEKERPEEIVLHLTRTYEVDGEQKTDDTFQKEIHLSSKDYQSKNTWETTVSGEEYKAYYVGADNQKYYYTYWISEDTLSGYDTKITYKGEFQYGMTITNTKQRQMNLLPGTGGIGTTPLYTIGILLLAFTGMTEVVRRRKRKAESL